MPVESILQAAARALARGDGVRADELLDAVERARPEGGAAPGVDTAPVRQRLDAARTAAEAVRYVRWLDLAGQAPEQIPPCPVLPLGPWNLLRPLGQGAMGSVFLARHHLGAPDAALKVLADTADPHRLAAEARAVGELDHPSIVRLLDVGTVRPVAAAASGGRLVAGQAWLAMEHAPDWTLAEAEAPRGDALIALLTGLCGALGHAHAHGILHLDVKPANVLRAGDTWKLCDFGLAFTLDGEPRKASIAGSPAFMAPEQCRGDWRAFGPPTDLYALGCLAWWLLEGRGPYVEATARGYLHAHQHGTLPDLPHGDHVPAGLSAWIGRCLARSPRDRFPSAHEAALALTGGRARLPLEARAPDRGRTAVHARRTPPVLGREPSRQALWDLLRRTVDDGEAHRVEVIGDPGLGRTSLLRWLALGAREAGVRDVLTLDGRSGLSAGLRDMMARELRTRGLLGDRLQRHLAERLDVPPTSPVPQLVARALQGGPVRGTALLLLGHLLRRRPVVLLADDLEPADRAWLSSQRLEGPLLLVVGATSPSGATDGVTVHIGPLDEPTMTRVLHEGHGLRPTLAHALCPRVGGNPAFARDLVHGWTDRAWLAPSVDGFDLTVPLDDAMAPGGSVEDRPWTVHALSAADVGGVEAAAHLGVRVRRDEILPLLDALGIAVSPAFEASIVDARLMHRTADGWVFASPHAREQLLDRARRDGRSASIHAACADVLDSIGGSRARIARHRVASGASDLAVEALFDALWAALDEEGDVPGADHLLSELDGVLPPDDPRRPERDVLALRIADERRDRALARALGEALLPLDLPGRLGVWVRVAAMRTATLYAEHDAALAMAPAAEAAAERTGDVGLRAIVRWNHAFAHRYAGDPDTYARMIAEAADLHIASGSIVGRGMGLRARAGRAMVEARFPDAAEAFADAAAAFEEVGHRRSASQAHYLAAASWRWAGEPHRAWPHSLAAVALADADRLGDYRFGVMTTAIAIGDRRTAELELEAAMVQRARRPQLLVDQATVAIAQLLLTSDRVDDEGFAQALQGVDRALEADLMHPAEIGWALEASARLAADRRPDRARLLLERSLQGWSRMSAHTEAERVRARLQGVSARS